MAGIHLQSVGQLERGKTTKLNQKTKTGLARALSIPTEYLEPTVRTTKCSIKNRRQETGDRRQETGDRRHETGDRRQETIIVVNRSK